MPARRFAEFLTASQNGALHVALSRYTQALMSMIARAVACNALHTVQQRACRCGRVSILNRGELEARACECYQMVREEFDRLLQPPNN
jgi:hypothetical protein